MKPNSAAAPFFLSLALLASSPLGAGTRTSAAYTVSADTADAGGLRATSAAYTHDASIGAVAGIATVASPVAALKAGYAAQLTEPAGLAVTASPTTINETQTRQLAAAQLLDDATTVALDPAAVSWSIVSGPLTAVSSGGLVTAGTVYATTPASVRGTYAGQTAVLGLSILDTIADNYGTYAGDGLDDAWQVQYFGIGNPNAAPDRDPDGDGHTNLFEFTAGLNPTSNTSVFSVRLEPVPGQSSQLRLVFSPRLSDRTYVVQYRTDLAGGAGWATLTNIATSDNGQERTVTDLAATEARKFYRVEITKP